MIMYAILVVIAILVLYYFVWRKPCEHLEMKRAFGVPTNLVDPNYADNLKIAQLEKLDRAAMIR